MFSIELSFTIFRVLFRVNIEDNDCIDTATHDVENSMIFPLIGDVDDPVNMPHNLWYLPIYVDSIPPNLLKECLKFLKF